MIFYVKIMLYAGEIMIRIMFVCYGNICRSPMAEFVLRDLAVKNKVSDKFYIASSATSTEEIPNGIGRPVYAPVQELLRSKGIDPSGKRAVQSKNTDYGKYDLFIGMDDMNIRNRKRILGGDPEGKVHKMCEYFGGTKDVDDPWYTRNFEIAYQEIYAGCEGLIEKYRGY